MEYWKKKEHYCQASKNMNSQSGCHNFTERVFQNIIAASDYITDLPSVFCLLWTWLRAYGDTGFYVDVSNPNTKGLDWSNARYDDPNGTGGTISRHLFHFLPPFCHAGE